VSITDACIDWSTTENVLRDARIRLADVLPDRSASIATPEPSRVGVASGAE
jgi:hypothetical protein